MRTSPPSSVSVPHTNVPPPKSRIAPSRTITVSASRPSAGTVRCSMPAATSSVPDTKNAFVIVSVFTPSLMKCMGPSVMSGATKLSAVCITRTVGIVASAPFFILKDEFVSLPVMPRW